MWNIDWNFEKYNLNLIIVLILQQEEFHLLDLFLLDEVVDNSTRNILLMLLGAVKGCCWEHQGNGYRVCWGRLKLQCWSASTSLFSSGHSEAEQDSGDWWSHGERGPQVCESLNWITPMFSLFLYILTFILRNNTYSYLCCDCWCHFDRIVACW